ncbi:MAG: hypothetical protein CBC97_00890 [Verrucomicrobiaceae bacterium TMED137]|nr:MAG: hypothetical protein CBC97_00890 [Verrucomicrobiaceae bacterium TMED137]HAE18845.1 hypothetical protein [Verrucomicrobiales bacterium]|tara:strand:+ start:570 stop:788 length:219 start_codon:yes stop_codon:yes gene_type:complete
MAERLQGTEKKSFPPGWRVKVESCLGASLMDGIPHKFCRAEILIAMRNTRIKEPRLLRFRFRFFREKLLSRS